MSSNSRIIIALDFPDSKTAFALTEQLDPKRCRLKIGIGMFTRYGYDIVEKLTAKGFDIFLDLKFHDIPHQVSLACQSAADIGVWMLNVHASGGLKMMEAAREGIAKINGKKPILIAVTILTSLNDQDIVEIGFNDTVTEQVLRLARLTQDAGLDGVVCSPQEAKMLRDALGKNFCLVTPGIRLPTDNLGDQKRTFTPEQAIAAGVDYMVIGRPITQAKDPMRVIDVIEGVLDVTAKQRM